MKTESTFNGHTYKIGEVWASSGPEGNRNAGEVVGFEGVKPKIRLMEVTTYNSQKIGNVAILENSMWRRIKEAKGKTMFLVIEHNRDYLASGDTLEEAIQNFEDEYHDLDDDCTVYEAKEIKVKKEVKYVVEGQ